MQLTRLGGSAFRQILLSNQNGDLSGVQLSNKMGSQFAVFLPDASEPGRVRYSCFDSRGFFSHTTFDTYADALKGAWIEGFTEPAGGTLEKLSLTDMWQAGSQRTALIMELNTGMISYYDYLKMVA